MLLKEVKDNRTRGDFHQLPFEIYKNDPHWIPHIKQDIEKVFNPEKNKKFRNGSAMRWVAYNDQGICVGRIAAFEDGNNKEYRSGCGFFECVNDEKVAFALFDQAKEWLAAKGMTRMDGPINFGENHQFWGLITENFNEPPYYGQNYNPEYYVKFFKDYGFKTYYKQYIFYRDLSKPLQEKFIDRAKLLQDDPYFETRSLELNKLEKYTRDFRKVYNDAWGNREKGFSEMSEKQSKAVMNSLKPILDPDLVIFAYYKNEPVGMYVQLPEINQIFKHVHGNLNLWGKLKFLYHKKRRTARRCFALVFGIAPEFQGKGVEGLIFKHMSDTVLAEGHYKDLVITWIGDFNPKMIRIVENLEAKKIREMACMRYLFDRDEEFKRKEINNIKPLEK